MAANAYVGKMMVKNDKAWILDANGWKITGASAFDPQPGMPPPLLWRSRNRASSNKAENTKVVRMVQSDGLRQRAIEANLFPVSVELGKFEDGKYFLWLHFSDDDLGILRITPTDVDHGTKFENMPKHITLGHRDLTVAEEEVLQHMVNINCDIRFRKWTPRPSSSTYLFDGELLEVCTRASEMFGFEPRKKWHVSF